MAESKKQIISRLLTVDDLDIMQQAASYTVQEALQQSMVARPVEQLEQAYAKGDAFGVLRTSNEGNKLVGHAMIHDEIPHIQRYGPFNLLRRRIYEVSAVFATERGNGYAGEAVVGLVREKKRLRRRVKERRFKPEKYVALVRVDNVSSNKLFRKLSGSVQLSQAQTQALPHAILNEPVGSGAHALDFIGYDITHVRR